MFNQFSRPGYFVNYGKPLQYDSSDKAMYKNIEKDCTKKFI